MPRPLYTDRLILRNWQESDRDLFHEINSDDQVMKFFPFRRDRSQSDALMDKIGTLIEQNGFSFAAIEIRETSECIGFCGLHVCGPELNLPKGTVEIGWRLATQYWGNGYAKEAATRWLEYGFEKLELGEIVSFAVADNYPSLAVMKRIGMTPQPQRDFSIDSIPDEMAHLRPHKLYALTREEWVKSRP